LGFFWRYAGNQLPTTCRPKSYSAFQKAESGLQANTFFTSEATAQLLSKIQENKRTYPTFTALKGGGMRGSHQDMGALGKASSPLSSPLLRPRENLARGERSRTHLSFGSLTYRQRAGTQRERPQHRGANASHTAAPA